MNRRYVHLTPRLSAALEMLRGSETVADIGCDHGRLTAALLQQGICNRVIASDISMLSLQKAEQLLRYIGLSDRVSFRCGDGLDVLKPNECDAVAILGMGGTLMCSILEQCNLTLAGAKRIVLQPMRAQADIREYLYRNRFRITDDRVISERDRCYQIFLAQPDTDLQPWPQGFPADFFEVGYQAFAQRDPNLALLCEKQLAQLKKQMKTAQGTDGEEKLSARITAYEQILRNRTE